MRNYESIREQKLVLSVPGGFRKGILKGDERASVISGAKTLDYVVNDLLDRSSYNGLEILDYGCGVKFTQAVLQYGLAIDQYYGLDIDGRMIAYLQQNVEDSRFTYDIVPFYNALYNEDGEKMSKEYLLPCNGEHFDLITMQSVMTHFNPHDFKVCLEMLGKYLKPNGKIFFTCILVPNQEENFKDLNPERHLLRACYNMQYALDLVQEAGMKVDKHYRPGDHEFLPDHIICSLDQ